MQAYHFSKADGCTQYSNEPIVIGKTLEAIGPLVMCENGLHGCKRIIDALRYAPGCLLHFVELSGEILEEEDKVCGRYRKVLSTRDFSRELFAFAKWCVRRASGYAKANVAAESSAAYARSTAKAYAKAMQPMMLTTQLAAAYGNDSALYAAYVAYGHSSALHAAYAGNIAVDARYAAAYAGGLSGTFVPEKAAQEKAKQETKLQQLFTTGGRTS